MDYRKSFGSTGFVGEILDEHSEVDASGYVSSEKRITGMMTAGRMLTSVRGEQYDYLSEPEDFSPDPTRRGDFDLVDAQRIVTRVNNAVAEARQNVQEGSGGAGTPPPVVTAVETPGPPK